ncbi:MAG: lyase family protein [Candidatus Acidiferrales bacterium]
MALQMRVKSIATGANLALVAVILSLICACTSQEKPQVVAMSPAPPATSTVQPPAVGGPTRMEKDLLGEKAVPSSAYWGVQTQRALENFQISGVPINRYPEFVQAWAIVKLAAARANTDVGAMSKQKLEAIEKASQAVMKGDYNNQFLVDWYQGGAGTSTNMDANEVLANVGLELTGHQKREYSILDPHDDLNMSQSTNDSYPTANQGRLYPTQRQACR